MVKIAICDDYLENIENLSKIIEKFFKAKEIAYEIKKFQCGNKLVSYCFLNENNIFDIIFLDIIMDKSNGIECAKKIREHDNSVKIVMVTASREYLLDGYEVNVNGYILKPYSEDDITRILTKKLEEIEYGDRNIMSITNKKNVYKVDLNKVIYFESFLRKAIINFKDDTKYEFYEKLDNLEQKLESKNFIRIHRSFLVNAYYIREIKDHNLVLTNGKSLAVSRTHINSTRERFMEYIEKQWED